MNDKERCVLDLHVKGVMKWEKKHQIYAPTLVTLERIHGDDISINKG